MVSDLTMLPTADFRLWFGINLLVSTHAVRLWCRLYREEKRERKPHSQTESTGANQAIICQCEFSIYQVPTIKYFMELRNILDALIFNQSGVCGKQSLKKQKNKKKKQCTGLHQEQKL